MKHLIIVKLLALKFSRIWDKNFKFSSYLNILSLVINSLAISLIILIITVNSGFKKNTLYILKNITGNTKIYNYTNYPLNNKDFNEIKAKSNDSSLSKVIQDKCIVKHNGISESVVLESLDFNQNRFNQINKYITTGTFTDSTIVVGQLLFEKLNIDLNDKISLITINLENKINVNDYIVSGVFQTDFLNFDSYVVFKSIESNADSFNYFISNFEKNKFSDFSLTKYQIYSLKDNNSVFLDWLNSYDNPFKILILFILIISSINIINSNYYLIFNKSKQVKMLMILGLERNQLKYILLSRSILMAILSLLIGGFTAYTFLYIEKSYNFINIPEYVYFTKSLPIDINFQALYIVVPYLFIVSLISLIITYETRISK